MYYTGLSKHLVSGAVRILNRWPGGSPHQADDMEEVDQGNFQSVQISRLQVRKVNCSFSFCTKCFIKTLNNLRTSWTWMVNSNVFWWPAPTLFSNFFYEEHLTCSPKELFEFRNVHIHRLGVTMSVTKDTRFGFLKVRSRKSAVGPQK